MRSLRRLSGSIVASLLLCVPVLADDADPAARAAQSEAPAAKARKALDQLISVDYDNVTLTEVLKDLRDRANLNIVIDPNPDPNDPNAVVVDPEGTTISFKRKEAKVRTVLRNLLNPHNLTFVYLADEEAVVIAQKARATERQLGQAINLAVDKETLTDALKRLSKETGVNVVLDPRQADKAKEAITLHLEEVPLDAAVRLLAQTAGLRVSRVSNVLLVTSKETALEIEKEEEAARMKHLNATLGLGGLGGAGLGAIAGGIIGRDIGAPAPPVPAPPPNPMKPPAPDDK